MKCTRSHCLSWFQIEHLSVCRDSKLETVFIMLQFLNTVKPQMFPVLGHYAAWHPRWAKVSFTQWVKLEHVQFYGPQFHRLWFLWTVSIGFALGCTQLRLQSVLLSVTKTFDLLPMTVVLWLLSYKLLCPKTFFSLFSVCPLWFWRKKLWEKKHTLFIIIDNLKVIERKWRQSKAVYS